MSVETDLETLQSTAAMLGSPLMGKIHGRVGRMDSGLEVNQHVSVSLQHYTCSEGFVLLGRKKRGHIRKTAFRVLRILFAYVDDFV